MRTRYMVLVIAVLCAPILLLIRLFSDPLAIKRPRDQWRHRDEHITTIDEARRPY